MTSPPVPLPTRVGISSTRKGIYLMRYFLFSGGLAIGGAMVQRLLTGGEKVVLGLFLGLALGLLVFRGQLRALRWPTLLLGRDSLFFLGRKRVVELPWEKVRSTRANGHFVTVELSEALTGPDDRPVDHVLLDARHLGTATTALSATLQRAANDPEARQQLPPDEAVRALAGRSR